ncbi:MAG: hypothetical protein IKL05_03550 [Clostridia bacterium]|nr:hypothetical protein [Clostridia bacterium]
MNAQEYYSYAKEKIYNFKKRWEAFTIEAPNKLSNLIAEGISFSKTLGISEDIHTGEIKLKTEYEINSNTDFAEGYIGVIKYRVEKYAEELMGIVEDIDVNLYTFVFEGLDNDLFNDFVDIIDECIKYFSDICINISSGRIGTTVPDSAISIQKKWENTFPDEVRKNESERLGIPIENLGKHIKYLEAKKLLKNATTSTEINDAKEIFILLNGYLDSSGLVSLCDEKNLELEKNKVEKIINMKQRAAEGRRKREEELRQKREKEEKQEADYYAVQNECERNLAEFKNQLEVQIEIEINIAKKENEALLLEAKEEFTTMEKELSSLGFFKFSDKNRLKNEINNLQNKIDFLSSEQQVAELEKHLKSKAIKVQKKYKKQLEDFFDELFPFEKQFDTAKKAYIDSKGYYDEKRAEEYAYRKVITKEFERAPGMENATVPSIPNVKDALK